MPIRVAVRMATGRDGIAQPAQLPRSSTPNGRGRSTVASRTASRTARKEPTNTTRWRKRRNASNAITVAQRSAPTVPTDPVEATIASMRPVRPGRRSPASHRTTASSHTVTATPRLRLAGPKLIFANVTRTTAAAAHQTPVIWILRGSGGGAPVGRRRRPDRRTSGAPGRAGPTSPGSTGRWVDSICSSCNQATTPSISSSALATTGEGSNNDSPLSAVGVGARTHRWAGPLAEERRGKASASPRGHRRDPEHRIPVLPAPLAHPGGHRRGGGRPLHPPAVPARRPGPHPGRGGRQWGGDRDRELGRGDRRAGDRAGWTADVPGPDRGDHQGGGGRGGR